MKANVIICLVCLKEYREGEQCDCASVAGEPAPVFVQRPGATRREIRFHDDHDARLDGLREGD